MAPRHRKTGIRFATSFVTITASLIWAGDVQCQAQAVQLGVLVLSAADVGTQMMTAGLDEGLVPHTTVDITSAGRPTIDAGFLIDTSIAGVRRAKYQAVVLPNDAPMQLSASELSALADFEREFHVRELDAYVFPTSALGMNSPTYSGSLDGMTASVTSAAQSAGFAQLVGPVPFDDLDANTIESYGYLGEPLPDDPANARQFTVLVDMPIPQASGRGVIAGVYSDHGREQMIITAAMNQSQLQEQLQFPGILEWLTSGVHLGSERNYLSVHIDDMFLGDQRWVSDHNCTSGDDCPADVTAPDIHVNADDVDYLLAWQSMHGMKLDMVFNGGGYDDVVGDSGSNPVADKLIANRDQLRWINHTYSHEYLGCVQDLSVLPWRCVGGPDTPTWVDENLISTQISSNISFATTHAITLNPAELVTGEHSGLRRTPQEPSDNPNLAPALDALGVHFIGSDSSRESAQRSVGGALTVPRYPLNIFYNVGHRDEEVDEYNWIYNSVADGGSGVCATDPSSSCIAPLNPATDFPNYIVPLQIRIALMHVLANSPRPHYAHESNLAEDRILYDVLNGVLSRYAELWSGSAPLLNLSLSDLGAELQRQQRWHDERGQVSAAIEGKRLVVRTSAGILAETAVPMSIPTSVNASLDAYGGSRTGWTTVKGFLGSSYVLSAPSADSQTCQQCDAGECASDASACSSSDCQTVYTCLLQSHCAASGAPEACFCGGTSLSSCASQGGDGPCASAITQITGTTDAMANLQRINDPHDSVGAAFARALCDRDLCNTPCATATQVTVAAVPSLPSTRWLALLAIGLLVFGAFQLTKRANIGGRR